MRSLRRVAALIAAFFAVAPLAARAEVTVAVMPVYYKNAAELAAPLERLLSGEGKIVVDPQGNALIVRDWRANIYAIREELKKLDVRPRRVRITAALAPRERAEGSIRWFFSSPLWAQGELKEGRDLFFGIESTPLSADKALPAFSRQLLLLDADKSGKIVISERVGDAAYLFRYGIAEGYIAPQAQFRDIATAFTVSCEPEGEGRVAVTLTPTLVRLDGGSDVLFPKAHLLTVLEPGKPLVVGESQSDPEGFGGRFLTLFTPTGESRPLFLVLSAILE